MGRRGAELPVRGEGGETCVIGCRDLQIQICQVDFSTHHAIEGQCTVSAGSHLRRIAAEEPMPHTLPPDLMFRRKQGTDNCAGRVHKRPVDKF